MKKMLIVLLGLMVISGASAFGQEVSLDWVDAAMAGTDSLQTGQEVSFYIRFNNNTGQAIGGTTNGFKIYSDDGANWGGVSMDTLGTLTKDMMDGNIIFDLNRVTGSDADTVGFSTFIFFGSGMPAGFNDTVLSITIGPLGTDNHGKTICLDSTYYPPSGLWKWAAPADEWIPFWDGPHCWTIIDPADVAERPGSGLPEAWSLGQNYPNPFNSSTQIQFDVQSRSHVSLVVYNVLGQQVSTLVDENLGAGSYTVDWDGDSDAGSAVSSGIYFYRLQSDTYVDTKKMVLMK